jgi:hypothetical protein
MFGLTFVMRAIYAIKSIYYNKLLNAPRGLLNFGKVGQWQICCSVPSASSVRRGALCYEENSAF